MGSRALAHHRAEYTHHCIVNWSGESHCIKIRNIRAISDLKLLCHWPRLYITVYTPHPKKRLFTSNSSRTVYQSLISFLLKYTKMISSSSLRSLTEPSPPSA